MTDEDHGKLDEPDAVQLVPRNFGAVGYANKWPAEPVPEN